MGTEFQFGRMKMFWTWIGLLVEQQHKCTKCHEIVHLNMANFILSEFDLNLKTTTKTGGWLDLAHAP